MPETLHQPADARESPVMTAVMQESLYHSGYRRLSIRLSDAESLSASDWLMQETLYQTADAGDSIRQRI